MNNNEMTTGQIIREAIHRERWNLARGRQRMVNKAVNAAKKRVKAKLWPVAYTVGHGDGYDKGRRDSSGACHTNQDHRIYNNGVVLGFAAGVTITLSLWCAVVMVLALC